MRRILDSLSSYREYLTLTICILLSAGLLASGESPQVRTIRSVTVLSLGFLQDIFDIIPNYLDLETENRILREQNLTLSEELSRLREASLENARLRRLLSIPEDPAYPHVAAQIIGKNFQFFRNTITLNVGTDHGVAVDMPVVTHNGLVGRVVSVSSKYSVAQTLFHLRMRTSAKVQRSRVDGILGWDGGRYLQLRNVAKTLDIREGDLVVTSEYSSVFPPGVPIGYVASTSEEVGDLFQSVEIVPIADLFRLEEVFVVLKGSAPERTPPDGEER